MDNTKDETTYFRYIRTLHGRLEPVDVARHNGRLVARFSPAHTDPEGSAATSSDFRRLIREVMYALNRTERRTWGLLLLGNSIVEVARAERVSRAAIYERIRCSKGYGGMVRKNDYVRIWWRNQRKGNTHVQSF